MLMPENPTCHSQSDVLRIVLVRPFHRRATGSISGVQLPFHGDRQGSRFADTRQLRREVSSTFSLIHDRGLGGAARASHTAAEDFRHCHAPPPDALAQLLQMTGSAKRA
jgi:hypothetical protein